MSVIFGLYGSNHSACASLMIDGEIISCIEEERMTRIKAGYSHNSYPDLAVQKIEEITGIKVKDADYNVFVEPFPVGYAKRLTNNNFEVMSHHESHCYGAYFTSGFQDKCIVLSYDGGGLTSVLRVYLCEDGKMTLIKKGHWADYGSLSHLWGFATASIMGYDFQGESVWRMCKDEGKLMGMAPNGRYDESIYNTLKTCIDYEKGSLQFFPSGTNQRTKFVVDTLFRQDYFVTQEGKEVFSYNLQKLTEDLFLDFLDDLHNLYPEYKKLCFSGGLFGNVKLNQKINELPWVDEIYVLPPMGDEGLALGACIFKANQLGEYIKPKKLKNVFFGTSFTDEEVLEISKSYDVIRRPYVSKEIASLLDEGKIIGWFDGKFEHGPRALGARSILVKPTELSTHKVLNTRLKRHDTMPFAPIVMEDYFDDIFTCPKSKYGAQFMTICFSTKEEWIDMIPAVIQKTDKTARPQVVNKDNLPKLWEILDEYREISGIPVLLNTSFNAHDEPIIENPTHALDHLKNGIIDELVIGNYVYIRK